MIFKRIAALIVAVGLVVSAISVRKALDDDGGGTATPSDSTDASSPGDLGQIVCIEDLRAACSGFDGVTIEPWIATVDRLAAGDQIGQLGSAVSPLVAAGKDVQPHPGRSGQGFQTLKVLTGEDFGRRHHHALTPCLDRDQKCQKGDQRLARAASLAGGAWLRAGNCPSPWGSSFWPSPFPPEASFSS